VGKKETGVTKDDIIRMAREADLLTTTEPNGYQVWIPENLERFAALVAAAEREECANLAFNAKTYLKATAAIRARGNK
jgi:hypothetical protein